MNLESDESTRVRLVPLRRDGRGDDFVSVDPDRHLVTFGQNPDVVLFSALPINVARETPFLRILGAEFNLGPYDGTTLSRPKRVPLRRK